MFKTEKLNGYYAAYEIVKFVEYSKKHKHELGKYNGSYSLYRKCRVLFRMENAIVKYGKKPDTRINYNYIKYQMRKIYKEIQAFKRISSVDLEK